MANKTSKKQPDLVVNNITIMPVTRDSADIGTWRNALKAADRGKRRALYNLYEDLMLDPILSDAIDKRIEAITNAELVFQNAMGEAVPVMDDLLDTTEFEKTLTEIMLAKFWGITLLETNFIAGFNFESIPRKHIRPDLGEILINESDERGVPYRGDDFFLEVGGKNDLGLILKAAPYVIYKRGGFGDWAEYAEIFGMPFQVAKYSNYDDVTRIKLEQALSQAGGKRVAVIPKESDIDYKDNKSSGDGAIYDRLRMACIQEILILILGQTMTTLDGSSKSQSETHMEVLESKHKADRRFVQRVLNRQLLPILEKRGYPVSGGRFSFPEAGETVSMAERMAIVKDAATLVPVPESYIYDTFGIPKPADGEEAVQPLPAMQGMEPPPDNPDDHAASANLFARARSFFVGAPEAGAYNGAAPIADEEGDDFDTRLAKRVARGQASYFDAELFAHFAGNLTESLGRGFAGKQPVNDGFDYDQQNDVARTAMETNLFHFSAAKTLAEVQQLNQIYRESKGVDDFLERAGKMATLFNKTWARTEYNTAGAVAESTATYNRLMSQASLFPYWEYRTAGDDKVRDEHAALDGVILPANDELWRKIYPPNGWSCRCYVVPRMRQEVANIDFNAMRQRVKDYFKTTDYKNAEAQGFGRNRAVLGEVFDANQMYIRKFPDKAAKYLDKLGAPDYGLPSVSKCKAGASQEAPRYDGSAEEWFARRQKDGVVTLTDYNGRAVQLTKITFKGHTTGSHKDRVAFLDAMPKALNDPDEVWLNNYDQQRGKAFENYSLIKYYQDEMVVVCCQIDKGRMNTVNTWFPLKMRTEVITKHRRGLLVHKKAPR